MLFLRRIIFNVGCLFYFRFSKPQPLVAVEREAVARGGCRYRLSTHNCCFIFCDFFLGFLIGFAIAEAVLDLAGQLVTFDVPRLPAAILFSPFDIGQTS